MKISAWVAAAAIGLFTFAACSGRPAPQAAGALGSQKGSAGQYYYVNLFTPPIGGTVTSDKDGINCGASAVAVDDTVSPPVYKYTYNSASTNACQVSVPWSDSVVLTATPTPPNAFLGWAGDCSGYDPCVLTPGADKGVVAIFGAPGSGHPNFMAPELHKPAYYRQAAGGHPLVCTSCHGQDLRGQGIAPSCGACHGWPRGFSVPSGTFAQAGDMTVARSDHTATLLPNGLVLIAGGVDALSHPFATAELFDPATRTFSATGSMISNRANHAAVLLPDGRVLFAGGMGNSVPLWEAELYDPATGRFTATNHMNSAHSESAATLLPNGKVLLAGGRGSGGYCELYDPSSGTFQPTGPMATSRRFHTATLLPSGQVLVVGGFDDVSGSLASSAEIYDPATGSFTNTGSMLAARDSHTATLLPNGKVLIAGGLFAGGVIRSAAELYDPTTGKFTPTGSMAAARRSHAATLLPSGRVLVVGGFDGVDLASAEIYDPATGSFSATGDMGTGRKLLGATTLPVGLVLITGGSTSSSSAELYRGD